MRKGDYAKIIRNGERFWSRIDRVDGDAITGTVDNETINSANPGYGEKFKFKREEVIAILTREEVRGLSNAV